MTTPELLRLSKVHVLIESGAARAIRESNGLTLSDVATEIDVSVPTLSRWERNLRSPRRDVALRYGLLIENLIERRRA